ncbi:MAG: tetratricopeptide repeat protein [Verrucomicrobia bacterium]|nr:tetratricopeptide repeat protein [Verrucomicrobiota bacterium]
MTSVFQTKDHGRNAETFRAEVCLVAITLAVFWQAHGFDFIHLDDAVHVLDNPHIQNGLTWSGIRWAFTADLFSDSAHADYWQPVTFLSRMLDIQLFGLNPSAHHLINLGYHILNTLLLFHVLRRMTTTNGWRAILGGWPPPRGGHPQWVPSEQATMGGWPPQVGGRQAGSVARSAMVAALFAVHPLRVESVVWIVERKDTLSGLFWILTMQAYWRYAMVPCLGRYVWVLVFFGLGLMSKPSLITLPVALLLMDYWPLNRWRVQSTVHSQQSTVHSPQLTCTDRQQTRRHGSWAVGCGLWTMDGEQQAMGMGSITRLILEKCPLIALSAISFAITWGSIAHSLRHGSAGAVVSNAAISYGQYLWKMIIPVNLAIFQPRPLASPSPGLALLSAILVAGISLGAVRTARRCPYFFTGWFWFIIGLLPVVGLSDIVMADRFTYLPSVGAFVALVWGVAEWTTEWRRRAIVLRIAAVTLIGGLMFLSWSQTRHWRNSLTVFDHALRVTSDNAEAHFNFAVALADAGKGDEAMEHYREALRIAPGIGNDSQAQHRFALALARAGRIEDAIVHYGLAIRLCPSIAEAHNNLANLLAERGRTEEAFVHWREAARIDPAYPEPRFNQARALALQGRKTEAEQLYLEVLKLDPGHVRARHNLGALWIEGGRVEEGIQQHLDALRIRPDSPGTHFSLGCVYFRTGKRTEAIQHWSEAVRLDASFADAHVMLGRALDEAGRGDEAIRHLEAALRLNPRLSQAENDLGLALCRQGQFEKAFDHFARACQIKPDFVEGLCNLANMSLQLNRPAESVSCCRQAIKIQPDSIQAHALLAAGLDQLGKRAEAARVAQKAAELARRQGRPDLARAIEEQTKLSAAERRGKK